MKNNPNQICWLLEKVPRSLDAQNGFSSFQQFLDNQQYTSRGILRYEKMFGAGYVSTGGSSTTKVEIKRPEERAGRTRHMSGEHLPERTEHLYVYLQEFVDLLNLRPGQKVLDVGCGIGGGDFYMAKVL